MFFEPLEQRQLLAGDLDSSWQYAENPLDTNADGQLSPSDALLVINQFAPAGGEGEDAYNYMGYPDVNGDSTVNGQDSSMVVNYLNSVSGGSTTSPTNPANSNSGTSSGTSGGAAGSSGTGTCAISGGGLQVSGPTSLSVNEKDDFTATICWQDAYWLTIAAPYITPSAALVIDGAPQRITDNQGNPRPIWVPSSGQAVLQLGYPDDAPTGTSSDVLQITVTGFAYYNQVSAPHIIDVTVNNVPPTVSVTALTPEINEGDTARVQVIWGQAYWYEYPGATDLIGPVLTWGDGSADMSDTEACTGQYGFTTNAGGDAFFETCMVYRHTYLDDDPTATPSDNYTVTVNVADDDLGSDADSTVVKVNNVAPTVTITSITPIDSVSPDEGGVDGRLDETEGFIVQGTVTDPGVLDTFPVAKIEVDLNFDGTIDPNTEKFGLTLQGGNGSWTFVKTITPVLDDGASYDTSNNRVWGNETEQDPLTVTVTVEDDDTGNTVEAQDITVYNVVPKFIDNPNVSDDQPSVSFVFDANGKLISATLDGSFSDIGTLDFHRIGIDWGDGGEGDGTTNPIQLDLGTRQFAITRDFDPLEDVSPDSLYPILIELNDDDLGHDTWLIRNEPCGCDESAPGSASHALSNAEPGPTLFAQAQQQPAPPAPVSSVAATGFVYTQTPGPTNLHTMGFKFGWQMTFNNAAASLIAFQKVEYTLQGFDKRGALVHTATFNLIDLIRLQLPGATTPPFFNDSQDTRAIQLRLDKWVTDDGVCSFLFNRTGDMRLVPASGVRIYKNGGFVTYDPTTDIEGMVFSELKVDGVLIPEDSGSLTSGGIAGPNIGDAVDFIGPAQYRATWNDKVVTTVKWVGVYPLSSPTYNMKGRIKWPTGTVGGASGAVGLVVFPEKPLIAPNIDITAARNGATLP